MVWSDFVKNFTKSGVCQMDAGIWPRGLEENGGSISFLISFARTPDGQIVGLGKTFAKGIPAEFAFGEVTGIFSKFAKLQRV